MAVKAIRGAITAEDNTREAILEVTQELLSEIIAANSIQESDMISIIFTATEDLNAEFPAVAARNMGLTSVPLLCCRELNVEGAPGKCVRILLHLETSSTEIKHIYLRDAKSLRNDLTDVMS